jgi:hypothetical protein
MTRKFSLASDGLEWGRTSRAMSTGNSINGEPARTYPIGQRTNQQNLLNKAEGDKDTPRKRIAVAVSWI